MTTPRTTLGLLFLLLLLTTMADNAMRLIGWVVLGSHAGGSGTLGREGARALTGFASTAPFVFLSFEAGRLADRLPKSRVLYLASLVGLAACIATMVAIAFGLVATGLVLLLLALAARFCFIGPSGYGMLPEILPERQLGGGNGALEAATFLGAILGTLVGGLTLDAVAFTSPLILLPGLVVLGTAGMLSWVIFHKRPPRRLSREGLRARRLSPRKLIHILREVPGLGSASLAVMLWWMLCGLALQTALKLAEDSLHLGGFGTSRFFIYTSFGVAIGAALAGTICRSRLHYGLAIAGAVGTSLCGWFPLLLPMTEMAQGAGVAAIGFAAGLTVVPLKAMVQALAPKSRVGSVLAGLNWFQYTGLFVAVGPVYLLMAGVFALSAEIMFGVIGMTSWVLVAVIVRTYVHHRRRRALAQSSTRSTFQ